MKPVNEPTRDRRRERARRLVRLEQLMAQGLTSTSELAAAFQVTAPIIIRDMKCIERDVLRRTRKDSRKLRQHRIMQMESVLYEARNAFNRSRQDAQETTISRKVCSDCVGTPGDPNEPCVTCSGTGEVVVETVKIRGQAGDAAFLRIAAQAIVEAGKLEGLYERKVGGSIGHAELALVQNVHVNTPLEGETVNPYAGAPAEMLIEARAILQRIREAMPGPGPTIDVTATEPVEGD